MLGVRSVGGVAVFVALAAAPIAGADPDSGVPTGPDDPRCATIPEAIQCQGSPYAPPTAPTLPPVPTGPLDTQCMQMPASAACVGSPYLPQSAPPPPPAPMAPPIGGGMPGMPGHI
jgi:hypothetical protein